MRLYATNCFETRLSKKRRLEERAQKGAFRNHTQGDATCLKPWLYCTELNKLLFTTLSGGSLGSRVDEERSQLRDLV